LYRLLLGHISQAVGYGSRHFPDPVNAVGCACRHRAPDARHAVVNVGVEPLVVVVSPAPQPLVKAVGDPPGCDGHAVREGGADTPQVTPELVQALSGALGSRPGYVHGVPARLNDVLAELGAALRSAVGDPLHALLQRARVRLGDPTHALHPAPRADQRLARRVPSVDSGAHDAIGKLPPRPAQLAAGQTHHPPPPAAHLGADPSVGLLQSPEVPADSLVLKGTDVASVVVEEVVGLFLRVVVLVVHMVVAVASLHPLLFLAQLGTVLQSLLEQGCCGHQQSQRQQTFGCWLYAF